MHTKIYYQPRGPRLLCGAVLAVLLQQAAATTARADLGSGLNEAVKATRKVSRELSVHVVELASGEEIYSYNADRPRIIASNTKLLTTAAAFDYLDGTDFRAIFSAAVTAARDRAIELADRAHEHGKDQ